MARKLRKDLTQPGDMPKGWGKANEREAYNTRLTQRAAEEEMNRRVIRRQELADALSVPQAARNEFTRGIGDAVVDAEAYLKSPQARQHAAYAAVAGGVASLGGTGAAYLGNRYEQQVDGLPTDPFSVVGRMASGGGPVLMGAVGTDPLAQARLNIQEAQRGLGSDAVLAAVVDDQLSAASQPQQSAFDQQVSAMVDARAQELQGTPIQKSDGSVAPMPYDTAIRLAQEEVGLQLRAEGIV